MSMRILISDDLSAEAKTILERIPGAKVDFKIGLKPAELKAIIGEYDALAVRSATKVTAEILAAAPKLRVIGLVSPAAVVVLGHVEQPEGDDLILVTDVAGMVGALQAGRHRLARLPGAAKGLPRAWLQAAGGEHDDHFDLLW